jgi:tripeptide aminopeptidase
VRGLCYRAPMKLIRMIAAACAALLAAAPVAAQSGAEISSFTVARAQLARDYDRTIEELIRITETPAPPFKEEVRARLFADMLRAHGLEDVEIDEIGNVTGLRPGTASSGPLLVVSAHLDTVFPEGTPIAVRREGDRLFAPGIGDDSMGLATILAWVRAMDAAGTRTRHDMLFMGTVGEEGPGDLRGVRHFFSAGKYRERVGAFVSIDGTNVARVVNGAVGSRRYRVAFSGPGGHSYGAFGTVNPMAAMADTIQRLYLVSVPAEPRTTYSASVVGGGTSVNTIPADAFVEIDMRSPDPTALERLERRMIAIVAEAVAAENHARSTANGEITVELELIGDRPAGLTDPDHPFVRLAIAAIRAHGYEPELTASSTDSNIPMSLGIPAVTIGAGAGGGRAHTVDEYVIVDREPFLRGLSAGLAFVLMAAGAE